MSEFGDIITPSDLEESIVTVLEKWSPTYLRYMERHTGRDFQSMPNIESYRAANAMNERLPEQATPACQVMMDEQVELVTKAETITGVFTGDIDILVGAPEPELARQLAGLYAFSTGMLMIQKYQMESVIKPEGMAWTKLGVPGVGENKERWLAIGSIQIVIHIEKMLYQYDGPLEPIEIEPGDYPKVEHSRLEPTLEEPDV